MAYASVASLLVTIDLVNYHGDSSISSRFKDQISSLEKHTSFLQSFLEDDPNRAENWEETIRDVADRAEEIIDILVSDSLLKPSTGSELDFSLDELEKVTEEMESTADGVQGRRSIKAKDESDEELMKIVSLLCEGSSNLETIAIVGIPGMGKSALAADAFDHKLVREHFDIRAWSTVGQQRRSIALELLEHINVEIVSNTGDEAAVESLYTSLTDRRYLIVLRDVWDVDAWDYVRRAFPDNGNGSRIVLTTGLLDMASSVSHVHEMSLLDEDRSWNLLRDMIFGGEPCPSQLESMGKMIARSCGGHQLTIEVISRTLAANKTEAVWEDVSEYINSNSDDNALFRVIFLCYTYLPHHSMACFLYLGCFPANYELNVSKFIKLWVAEGFLNQSESKSFQETGEEHVLILVQRRLVSVSRWKSNGRIKSIIIHGLVQEACLQLAQTGNFLCHGALWFAAKPYRRVSSSDYTYDSLHDVYASTLRTIISYPINNNEVCFGWSIGNVRLLRILDLSSTPDYDLPEQVFHLFHLRYLAFFSGFSISEAISNLQNLQTLIIFSNEYSRKLIKMPEGIWRMPQLRHLLSFCFHLPPLKQGEAENSALENLETLSRVTDFVCSRENLKMIPNVKKLSVAYNKSFKDAVQDFELHNLISLHKLEILKIEMQCSFPMEKHNKMIFAFPPTLKKLNLYGLQLPWEDMKIVDSLPNLQVLKLRTHAFIGNTWETSEGGFSRLMHLRIEGFDLEHWITRSSHFPMLEALLLCSCLHLSKVPYEIGEIPTLEYMAFDGKNQSLLNSAKQIKEDRQSLGDDFFQVILL